MQSTSARLSESGRGPGCTGLSGTASTGRIPYGYRLAAKQAEKDRYVRLYAQGHISEEELDVYLLDLKNLLDNLRLLIKATEADLSRKQEN